MTLVASSNPAGEIHYPWHRCLLLLVVSSLSICVTVQEWLLASWHIITGNRGPVW
jgi:hypothetical protein